jgi:hypothetical protein
LVLVVVVAAVSGAWRVVDEWLVSEWLAVGETRFVGGRRVGWRDDGAYALHRDDSWVVTSNQFKWLKIVAPQQGQGCCVCERLVAQAGKERPTTEPSKERMNSVMLTWAAEC